jgi:hypothetical protein
MKIGETFFFIGKDIQDEHFKNFTYGRQYTIKSISSLADTDIYGQHLAILFENCEYGVLKVYFDKYFVKMEEYRDTQILKIIK